MMCIKLLRGIRFFVDFMFYLVKLYIYGVNVDLKFKKFQYGWFFNLLVFVNKEKIGLEIGEKIYRFLMCSVWYLLLYLYQFFRQFIDYYNKNKIIVCLMYISGYIVEGIDYYILNLFRIIWILLGKNLFFIILVDIIVVLLKYLKFMFVFFKRS